MFVPKCLGLCGLLVVAGPALAAAPMPVAMAPLAEYLIPKADEIAMARSAAPPSISGAAEIRVLDAHGYRTVAKGTNGFVCLVLRSWTAGFADPEFWNPKVHGPICYNPAAVHSVLPAVVERTNWALSGVTLEEMRRRARTSTAINAPPDAGAMCFMMSRQNYLTGADGPWHPHLMFWVYRAAPASWGANLPGSPVMGSQSDPDPVTTFVVPVKKWSDGTPDVPGGPAMKMN